MIVITLTTVFCYNLKGRRPGRGKFLVILCRAACILIMSVVKHRGAQGEKVHLQWLNLGIFLSSPSPALIKFFFFKSSFGYPTVWKPRLSQSWCSDSVMLGFYLTGFPGVQGVVRRSFHPSANQTARRDLRRSRTLLLKAASNEPFSEYGRAYGLCAIH